jgi:hypothetical protein
VGIGLRALFSNTIGNSNVATGNNALSNNISGENNTALGFSALVNNTDGSDNTAVGLGALQGNNTGDGNTAVGVSAGAGVAGDNNTVLGSGAGGGIATANNVICIGADVPAESVSNSCYIGNIFSVTSSGGSAVFVNANGKLGTSTSSRRFKEEIKPMDKASEAILALQPVTFRYKKEFDPTSAGQFGLVAEDVEKVNPDLVIRDKEGSPYSVRYDQVNAMLLNEFLKEHKSFIKEQRKVEEQGRKIQDQEATIAELRKQLQALDLRIQRISAQVESATSAQLVSVP